MNILIIEDEARIAKRLERMTRSYFEQNLSALMVCDSLQTGLACIATHPIDLLLLDLNLNGENGFHVLETMVAAAFHTIVVSANTDKAITAFEYGVLDFVPKPFDEPRLFQAFRRLSLSVSTPPTALKFLAVKKAGEIRMIPLPEIRYIRGAGIYSELVLMDGRTALHDKTLEVLEQLLPPSFVRIHRSYLIPLHHANALLVEAGGRYRLVLNNGEQLPVGRLKYKEVKGKLI